MFTDDVTLTKHNHQDAPEIITCFSKSAKAFGLKTKVRYQSLQNLMKLAKT